MDFRSRRFRTGLLLGTAFVAGVAIGPAAGLIGRHLGFDLGITSALAQAGSRADTYRLLTLFGDVFERVRAEYVAVGDRTWSRTPSTAYHRPRPHSSGERQSVPRHAGQTGRVRRPRHRGHPDNGLP
jgi:hypothetical protein